eukprot:scaffold140482_cov31-Tisochrysis_lutea.AAC.1
MNEGYFVGRKELTAWIREHFDPGFQKVRGPAHWLTAATVETTPAGDIILDSIAAQMTIALPVLQQVEDLASGAIYCQILNSVHPGSVQMSKVKMGAKTEVEYIHNFKQLQVCKGSKHQPVSGALWADGLLSVGAQG